MVSRLTSKKHAADGVEYTVDIQRKEDGDVFVHVTAADRKSGAPFKYRQISFRLAEMPESAIN